VVGAVQFLLHWV